MTTASPARRRVLVAILGIAALLFSACADAPVGDDPPSDPVDEVVEEDFTEVLEPGEQPSIDIDCFLQIPVNVLPTETPGEVSGEVLSECNSLANEQRLEVCIEVLPEETETFFDASEIVEPPADAPFETIGCETVVGSTLVTSTLALQGRPGNNWYRNTASLEVDATNDTGGTTTTVFPTLVGGPSSINCFALNPNGCLFGFPITVICVPGECLPEEPCDPLGSAFCEPEPCDPLEALSCEPDPCLDDDPFGCELDPCLEDDPFCEPDPCVVGDVTLAPEECFPT